MTSGKVWFITGASRGLGRVWASAALERGDRVAATARDCAALSDLSKRHGDKILPIELDVTNQEGIAAAVRQAHGAFGKLDIVLGNAGYGVLGAIEEATIEQARANFETNVFAIMSLVKASVPIMRAQGSGHILAVSSVGGLIALPLGGIYQATKFAVEGLMQVLALEVAAFNIHVTLIEPGPFKTDFMSSKSALWASPIAEYDSLREEFTHALSSDMFADPQETVGTLMRVVDAHKPPLHVMLGSALLPKVKEIYAARVKTWEDWQ